MKINSHESKKRRRERIAIIFILITFLLLTFLEIRLSRVSDTLPFVNSIFFFGILNINVILLIALFWLIFRNVGKLYWERRHKVLGARLKTKLVTAFLMFSIIPTLILFVISSSYINSSFDKWFSLKVQNTLQASLDVTRSYYQSVDQSTKHFATGLSEELQGQLTSTKKHGEFWIPGEKVQSTLDQHRTQLAVHSVEFYPSTLAPRSFSLSQSTRAAVSHFPRIPFDVLTETFQGRHMSFIQHMENGDLIRATAPVYQANTKKILGIVAIGSYIPVSLVNKVDEIASVIDDYKFTNPLQYPIKTTYFVILVMITLVIIAVAIWLGLYLARELTVPIERLARGARAVGSGNLAIQIPVSGEDEVAALIESFNGMTRDLKDNQEKLTQASKDLESRRVQLETILENIGAGVIVVSKSGNVISSNPAAKRILELNSPDDFTQKFYELLKGKADELILLVKKTLDEGSQLDTEMVLNTQWTLKTESQTKTLGAAVTLIQDQQEIWGAVIVIDDMTHLLKAQREVAWREVARRIAHEIKNPLTPIKLSAQRIQRRLGRLEGKDGEMLNECTETIVKHTDELKEMVNEFSNFASFPAITPKMNRLNDTIFETVNLYAQAHPSIHFDLRLQDSLPQFEYDQDQMKKVIRNLVENSVAALNANDLHQRPKKVTIESHYNERLHIALVSVEDNGQGMSEKIRSQIFEPYFSTKKEGTGLGLAIAKRIVNDHDGFIRVTSQENQGTKFWIELPTRIKHKSQPEWNDLNEKQDLSH